MKTFNFFLTHILCHCLLMLSMATHQNAYADDPLNGALPDPESAKKSFQSCDSIDHDDTAALNACIAANQAKAQENGLTVQQLDMGSGQPSASDINAEATHQDIAITIFALMIAYFAVLYIAQCPNNFSAALFTLAGGIVIIFEIIAWCYRIFASEQLEGSEVAVQAELNSGGSGSGTYSNVQKQALTKAKEKTIEAADWANARLWVYGVATGIMAGAMVMAILEGIWKITSWGSYPDHCIGTFTTQHKTGPESLYTLFYKNKHSLSPEQEMQFFLSGHVIDKYQQLEYNDVIVEGIKQSPVPQTYHDFAPNSDDLTGLFAKYEAEAKREQEQGAPSVLQTIAKKGVDALKNLFPEAHALDSQGWWDIIVGVLGTVVIILTIKYKIWAATSMVSGWVRAVFVACMMAVMIWACTITSSNEDKLRQRAAQYEEVIKALDNKLPSAQGAGPVTDQPSIQSKGGGSIGVNSESVEYNAEKPLGACVSGTLGQKGGPQGDPGCACAATNSCTKMDVPNVSIPSNIDISDMGAFTEMAKDARDGGNNMAKNMPPGKTLGKMGTAAFAARMKKMGDTLKSKYLDLVKKKGEKDPKSFDDLQKEFMTKVNKDLKAAEAKLTPEMISKLGEALGAPSDSKTAEKLKDLGIDQLAKAKGVTLPVPKAPTMGKLFADEEESAGSGAAKAEKLDTAEALNGFETPSEDILKDSGVSIFEQLSARYKKSAFPIFFIKKAGAGSGEGKAP